MHTPVQYVKCTYTQCTNRTVPYGIHIDNLKVQMSTSGVDPLEIDFDLLRPGSNTDPDPDVCVYARVEL